MEPRLSEQDNKRAEIATPPPAESDPEISLPGDPVEVTKERDKGGQLSPPPAPQSVDVPAAEPETETG
ncbi:MAG: hypothetical protein AB2531_03255, partial [Candidatus Thiodiazotropha sp.]